MTSEQILTKAIEKAVNNGWEGLPKNVQWVIYNRHNHILDKVGLSVDIRWKSGEWNFIPPNDIIFSHDFAKAFWKDDKEDWDNFWDSRWTYHLSTIVIKEDPIKYLEYYL